MKLYRMEQSDHDELIKTIDSARKTPLIALQCGMPESPQEAANRAWKKLGDKMGFDHMTARPAISGDRLEFMAEPSPLATEG